MKGEGSGMDTITVYSVIDEQIFNADERNKDGRLADLVTVEWAELIYMENDY